MKDPSFPFYARDWLVATRTMSPMARGAYIDLLCHQWLEGALPTETHRLRRVCAMDQEEFDQVWPEIAPHFSVKSDGLVNERIEELREERRLYLEKQKNNGLKGGRPRSNKTQTKPTGSVRVNPNHNPNKTSASASASASSSSSAIAEERDSVASATGGADKPPPPDPSEPYGSIERTFRIIATNLECPAPTPQAVRRHLGANSGARQCIEKLGVEQAADLYCWVAKHIPRSMPWSAIWEQHPALLHQMKNGVENLNGKRPYNPKAELQRLNALMEEEDAQSALS